MEQIIVNYFFTVADDIPCDEVKDISKQVQNPKR